MTDTDILALVRAALSKVRPEQAAEFDSVAMTTRFERLHIDSVDTLGMITFLEDRLGVVFEDGDLQEVESIGDLAALVRRRGH